MKEQKINELLAELGIKNEAAINLVKESITTAQRVGKKPNMKKQEFESITTTASIMKLIGSGERNKQVNEDNANALGAINTIVSIANARPMSRDDISNKRRTLREIGLAATISKNSDSKVMIIPCKVDAQKQLARTVNNIEPVFISLERENRRLFTSSNKEKNVKFQAVMAKLTDEILKSSENIEKALVGAFEAGYGSKFQQIEYGKNIFEENKEKIIGFIGKGQSAEKIAETLKISDRTFDAVIKESGIKTEVVESKKEEILKLDAEKKSLKDILTALKLDESIVDVKSLRTYVGQWKRAISNANKKQRRKEKAAQKTIEQTEKSVETKVATKDEEKKSA